MILFPISPYSLSCPKKIFKEHQISEEGNFSMLKERKINEISISTHFLHFDNGDESKYINYSIEIDILFKESTS